VADVNKNVNIKVNWHDQKAKTGVQKLKGGIDNVGKATDEVNKKSQNFFSRMSTGMKKKLAIAAGKFEQLNIAFETFLGSKEKATALINELDRFAAKTPFLTDQVNSAAKALLAFGFEAEEIVPTMKMLGDISAGTGKDLKELGIIFGQIKGAGRLMGQDLLQLINAGFNPLQIISEKTGKSMATLKDEMSKGLISFEMVTQAFKDATSEGGRFFNLTEKQSKSFLGVVSTLQSNIQILTRRLGEKLVPYMLELVKKLNEFVSQEENIEKIAFAFQVVVDTIILTLKPLTSLIKLLGKTKTYEEKLFDRTRLDSYNKAKEKYNKMNKEGNVTVKQLWESYRHYVAELENATKKYEEIDERNLAAVAMRNMEIGKLEGILDLLEEVINAKENEAEASKKKNTDIVEDEKLTAAQRKKIIKELTTIYNVSMKDIAGRTNTELKNMVKDFRNSSEKIKANWKRAMMAVSDTLGEINPAAKEAFDNVTGIIDAFKEGIVSGLIATTATVIDTIIGMFQRTEEMEKEAADRAIEHMEKIDLTRANLAIKALEEERDNVLSRFDLVAENYDNMTEVTRNYYDFLMAKEKEKYDLMTEDEKKEYDLKKAYAEEKKKVEKTYAEAIKKSQIEMAKIQLKIALARVETDRSEAMAIMEKEKGLFWSDEEKAAWAEMQGMYNTIKSDIQAQLASIGGLQKGGVIPGFGGGDKVSAKLEPGEAILPKEWQINPIPFFNQLLAMRGATQGVSNNISNMNSKNVTITGNNFNFQGANAKEVIMELQQIAEDTNSELLPII
jgi:tape measure domain-containing protein